MSQFEAFAGFIVETPIVAASSDHNRAGKRNTFRVFSPEHQTPALREICITCPTASLTMFGLYTYQVRWHTELYLEENIFIGFLFFRV